MKNPTGGQKVEKTPSGRRERTTSSPYKEKAEKILGKSDISKQTNKGKKRKKETRVAIETPAYRRTIERRAAASTKA